VESYLNYQGEKFTKRFDANSLLYLTKAIDNYELTSMEGSKSSYLFTSFTSDWLYPSHQSRELQEMAQSAGRPSRHEDIDLPYGHDAFLLDGEGQGRFVREFLSALS
jgi:homoserine O-acetyltransferase